ncbi:hypothetical protein B0J11DRAFT_507600 [Dendryphion nanum]|uniref:Uncharacterized protein n=1 Tax=Dendryphion nanum TaxID=256645 RepID=A0A9P9IKE6_9PLEO|nr:hypothetical protein B0J11DRAFT_507600 [Dendryphion nanum]
MPSSEAEYYFRPVPLSSMVPDSSIEVNNVMTRSQYMQARSGEETCGCPRAYSGASNTDAPSGDQMSIYADSSTSHPTTKFPSSRTTEIRYPTSVMVRSPKYVESCMSFVEFSSGNNLLLFRDIFTPLVILTQVITYL